MIVHENSSIAEFCPMRLATMDAAEKALLVAAIPSRLHHQLLQNPISVQTREAVVDAFMVSRIPQLKRGGPFRHWEHLVAKREKVLRRTLQCVDRQMNWQKYAWLADRGVEIRPELARFLPEMKSGRISMRAVRAVSRATRALEAKWSRIHEESSGEKHFWFRDNLDVMRRFESETKQRCTSLLYRFLQMFKPHARKT